MKPVQVVAITGGKGGVGKTNVSVNLAVAMSRFGRRVTLLDADLGLANVDVLLGLKPNRTLKDVLDGACSLSDVLIDGPLNVKIVPGASGLQEMVRLGPQAHAGLISAFSEIAHQMDVLLVDTAAGISDEVISFLCACQEILLVVCDEPTSITDAYALVKVINQSYGIKRVRVVCNMVRSEEEGRLLFQKLVNVANRFLDVELHHAGSLPLDDHMRRAVRKQKAVVEVYPTSKVSRALLQLAEHVDTWPIPATLSGHMEFFVEQLALQHQVA